MKRPRSPFGLKLLIILGVALSVTGVVLHLALPEKYERVELLPIGVGFTLALAGAYWLDPDRADKLRRGVTEAGADVVHSVVELRTGDRRTDPVVRVEKSTPVDDPTATPAVKVTVSQEGGSQAPITATEGIPDPANPQAEPLMNPVQWKDGKDDGTI
jgi:hypothetical protein